MRLSVFLSGTRVAPMLYAAVVTVLLLIVVALVATAVRRAVVYLAAAERVGLRPHALVSEVFDEIDEGDIILFTAQAHGYSNSIGTGTLYSHVGIVVRRDIGVSQCDTEMPADSQTPANNQTLCISEAITTTCAVLRDPVVFAAHGGARASPLLARLRHYMGVMVWVRRRARLDDAARAALREASLAPTRYPTLPELAVQVLGFPSPDGVEHCFQHATRLLGAIGVHDSAGDPIGARDGVFDSAHAVQELPGGAEYYDAVNLLYDLGAMQREKTQ